MAEVACVADCAAVVPAEGVELDAPEAVPDDVPEELLAAAPEEPADDAPLVVLPEPPVASVLDELLDDEGCGQALSATMLGDRSIAMRLMI